MPEDREKDSPKGNLLYSPEELEEVGSGDPLRSIPEDYKRGSLGALFLWGGKFLHPGSITLPEEPEIAKERKSRRCVGILRRNTYLCGIKSPLFLGLFTHSSGGLSSGGVSLYPALPTPPLQVDG